MRGIYIHLECQHWTQVPLIEQILTITDRYISLHGPKAYQGKTTEELLGEAGAGPHISQLPMCRGCALGCLDAVSQLTSIRNRLFEKDSREKKGLR